ncbi:MAG: HEAT repeat domain-containing protein [Planctomycetota bacterium]|jgi:hypothetical protein
MKKKVLFAVAVVAFFGALASLLRLLPGENPRVPDAGGMFGAEQKAAHARGPVLGPGGKTSGSPEFRNAFVAVLAMHAQGRATGEQWDEQLKVLEEEIERDGDAARVVCDQSDRLRNAKNIRLLGSLMRASKDADFVAELGARARFGKSVPARRASIRALEGRAVELWWEPVCAAYAEDKDPAVRDEAAGVLARHLSDPQFNEKRDDLRAVIAKGLASADAADRIRALRALGADPSAGPEQRELARRYRTDADPAVRAAAEACLKAQIENAERVEASGPDESGG